MLKQVLSAAAGLIACSQADAATITFSGLANGNPAVTSYSEAGFTFTTIAGTFNGTSGNGAPAPSVFTTNNGIADVTGGSFTFSSFQGGNGSFNNTPTFTVTGFLAGNQLYTVTYTGGGAGSFPTFTNGNSTVVVDRVRFAVNGTSANLDNIVVNAVPAVPEPATWFVMLVGFGVTGIAMRRKNTVTRVA